jgi:hypothetical protein
MGRRYSAVCDYLNIPHLDYDIGYDYSRDIDPAITRAIIATPVETHLSTSYYCIQQNIDFLCEKPVVKSSEGVSKLRDAAMDAKVNGYMVNNWRYVLRWPHQSKITMHNHFTGIDGLWDFIQPLYYTQGVKVVKHPIFEVKEYLLDNNNSLHAIESHSRYGFDFSYIRMLRDFWENRTENLMSLDEAILATEKIEDFIESGKNVY